MVSKTLYSSKCDEWETPQSVFDELDTVYHFDLDVCATEQNAKCGRFFDKAQDGLKKSWGGRLFGAIPRIPGLLIGYGKRQKNSGTEQLRSC
jgi:phage N-6-adenine-methyltransferase